MHVCDAAERRSFRILALLPPPVRRWTTWASPATIETVLIALGLLALLVLVPHDVNKSDGSVRYAALTDLLAHGRRDAVPFSIVGPLFAAPLWLVDRVTSSGDPVWVARYNWLLLVTGVGALYLLLRRHLPGALLRKFLLLVVFASMFTDHVRWFYGEVFTALAVGVGIVVWVVANSRGRWAGWLAAILGVVNTPAAMVGFAFVALARTLQTRRARYLVAPAIAAALILGESWVFRGGPFVNPYANNVGFHTVMPYSGLPGFSYPALFGLLAIFLSFGKGLIFFAPGMFLPIRSRLRDLLGSASVTVVSIYTLWLLFVAGLVLVYCRWWAWYGGWFWGPRFFLMASLPAALAVAVRVEHEDRSLWANLVTLGVLALSFWVGINGAVFDMATLDTACKAHDFAQEYLCHFVPEFSPLWRPFVVREALTWQSWAYIGLSLVAFTYMAVPLLRRIAVQVPILLERLRITDVLRLGSYRL